MAYGEKTDRPITSTILCMQHHAHPQFCRDKGDMQKIDSDDRMHRFW